MFATRVTLFRIVTTWCNAVKCDWFVMLKISVLRQIDSVQIVFSIQKMISVCACVLLFRTKVNDALDAKLLESFQFSVPNEVRS